jgi:hypothetical protein
MICKPEIKFPTGNREKGTNTNSCWGQPVFEALVKPLLYIFIYPFLVVLGFELRALSLLGRESTT